MHPFDRDYVGKIATAMMTRKGRQAAQASAAASLRIAAMRACEDPRLRLLGKGSVEGLGEIVDQAKRGRIRKASNL